MEASVIWAQKFSFEVPPLFLNKCVSKYKPMTSKTLHCQTLHCQNITLAKKLFAFCTLKAAKDFHKTLTTPFWPILGSDSF